MHSKALCYSRHLMSGIPKQMLLIMKFTAILLFVACLQVSATGYSQITLSERNAPLQKVFKEIQKQSGYDFLYPQTLLEQAGKITIELKNASLQQAVEECLKGRGLTYTILEKTIIIKKQEIPNEEAPTEPNLIDVKGRVTNETNANGEFELKAVDENATLVITGVNINAQEIKLNGRSDVAISTTAKITSLNEVIINKGYYTEKQNILLVMWQG